MTAAEEAAAAAAADAIARGRTAELKQIPSSVIRLGAETAGRSWPVVSGMVVIYFAMAAVFFLVFMEIPDTCESNMKIAFLVMGICNAAAAILAVFGTCVAKEMFMAMSHKALVKKWADNPERAAECRNEEEAFEHTVNRAKKASAGIAYLSYLVIICSLVFGIYGLVQTTKGTDENCGGSIITYWVLLCIDFGIVVLRSCFQIVCGTKSDVVSARLVVGQLGRREDNEVVGARA